MRTCESCGFWEPIKGHPGTGDNRVGSCLVNPPQPFPTMMPQSALQVPQAPQQGLQGVDPPTRAGRRACQFWSESHG